MAYEDKIAPQSAPTPALASDPAAASSIAFQKAQDRLSKHFDAHLPKGPQSASTRLAVLDYINENRSSILANNAEQGSGHHNAVHAPLRAIGIESTIAPVVIKTGARLFEAREQLSDRVMMQDTGARAVAGAQANWPQVSRDFENNRQKLHDALVPELPKGADMTNVRRQVVQAIKDNRQTIVQNGTPVSSDVCTAVWQPVHLKRLGDPNENRRAMPAPVHNSKLPSGRDFFATIAKARQQQMARDRIAANPAPNAVEAQLDKGNQRSGTELKYPLIAPEKIKEAARLFIERDQLANHALAGISKTRDDQSISSAGSNVLDDPRQVAMHRSVQNAGSQQALDNTSSDYAQGRILAQRSQSQTSVPHESSVPQNAGTATPADRMVVNSNLTGSPPINAAPSASEQSRISNDPRLKGALSPDLFSGQSPLTMNTAYSHTVSTNNRIADLENDLSDRAGVPSGDAAGPSPTRQSAGTLNDPITQSANVSHVSNTLSEMSQSASRQHVSATPMSGTNAAEQLLQDQMAHLPSLSPIGRVREDALMLQETGRSQQPTSAAGNEALPPVPSHEAIAEATVSPAASATPKDSALLKRSPLNSAEQMSVDHMEGLIAPSPSEQNRGSKSAVSQDDSGHLTIRSSEIPAVPSSQERGISPVGRASLSSSSSGQIEADNARHESSSDSESSSDGVGAKRARSQESETGSEERGQKRARVEDSQDVGSLSSNSQSSSSKGSGNGLVSSQAEEVSQRSVSEVSTEKESSDRSASNGSQSKESSDSWQSGASSDSDYKPAEGAVARAGQRAEWQAAAIPRNELRLEAREQLDLRLGRAASGRDYAESSESSQSSGYKASLDSDSFGGSDKVSSQRKASQSKSAETVSASSSASRSGASDARSGLADSQAIEDNRSYKSASMENPSHYSSVGSDGWRSGQAASDNSYEPSPSQLRRADAGTSSSSSGTSRNTGSHDTGRDKVSSGRASGNTAHSSGKDDAKQRSDRSNERSHRDRARGGRA